MSVAFDAEAYGFDAKNLFGFQCNLENAKLAILPIPWEATVSYGTGTSKSFYNILKASHQVDLFDKDFPTNIQKGIRYLLPNEELFQLSQKTQNRVREYLSNDGDGALTWINNQCHSMNEWVFAECHRLLNNNKFIGLLGGEHSVIYGYVKSLAQMHNSFSILHIDAHLDLRKAYQKITFSHASVMRNILEHIPQISKMVSVGIRDYSFEEYYYAMDSDRIQVFFDIDIHQQSQNYSVAKNAIMQMMNALDDKVYITLDIDGLAPSLCPNTGTPVPGGLSYNELKHLILALHKSKKHIIGFDIVENGFSTKSMWDANVSARVIFLLSCLMLNSQHL